MQITTYGQPTNKPTPTQTTTPSAPVPPTTPPATSTPTPPTTPPTYPQPDPNPAPPKPAPPSDPAPPGTPTQPPTTTPPAPTAKTIKPSTMSDYPILMDRLANMKDPPTVMQSVIYNRIRREYYITQSVNGSNGSRDPYESTVISRLDDDGAVLDQMKIWDAGHGTGLVIENYGSKNVVYCWLPLKNRDNYYYRFPYKSGTFKTNNIPSTTKLPKFSNASYVTTYHVDWDANELMERNAPDNNNSVTIFKKRKLSEFLKGIDTVYATVNAQPTVTRQGWTSINDSVYQLQGAYNGELLDPPQPTILDTYSWTTGQRIDQDNLQNIARDSDGHFYQDQHEPEGMSMYRDPTTGKASLIIGINTGGTGHHKYFVYRYSNIGLAPS